LSHIVQIQTQVKDAAAVHAACQRLGLPAPVQGVVELFSGQETGLAVQLPEWLYPVVCYITSGQMKYDNFGGRWGDQRHLDGFLQRIPGARPQDYLISHEIQLSSYAYLFRRHSRLPESGLEIRSLIKTKQPKVEFHPYPARSKAHLRRLFAVLREYLDALDAGRFNYRPGFGRSMCSFREQCSRWAG
jgi:hypothetical protein